MDATESIKQLKEEVAKFEGEKQSLSTENARLLAQVQELMAEVEAKTADYKRVQDMVMELENQNRAYQSNISYLDVSVEQMQTNLQ